MQQPNTMRTIHELLIILRDRSRVIEGKYIVFGLCKEVSVLYWDDIIDEDDMVLLQEYFENNMPNPNLNGFSFPRGQWIPRLNWLNKHIELTAPAINH